MIRTSTAPKKILYISVVLNLLLVLILISSNVFEIEMTDDGQKVMLEEGYTEEEICQIDEGLSRSLSTSVAVSEDTQWLATESFFNPYRLFYGEWIIAEWVANNSRFGPASDENIENMIGTTIVMERNFFAFGDEFTSQTPMYHIAIIPENPEPYFAFYPSALQLGIDTPFFVFVHVSLRNLEDILESSANTTSPNIIGFFIKDDNTMYLLSITDVYRLERVSHIEDNPATLNVAP